MKSQRNLKMIGALSVGAVLLTACGGGDDATDADSEEPIRIGAIMDQSGATGDVGAPYSEGLVAYVDHINENGGIEGREIEADVNDYAYEIPQAEDLYRRYVNDGVVAVMGWGTGDTEALRTRVANDELPFISGSFSEELADVEESPYNFLIAPTYSDQMRVALNWVAEEEGEATVAVLHNDSPFGTAPVGDGEEWIDEQGLDIEYSSHAIPSGTTNFAGLLNQISDADYIVVQDVAAPCSQLARDIASQGSDQTIIGLNWCSSELFVTSAGDAAEGHMMIQPVAPLSADVPGHEPIVDYLEEQGTDPDEQVVSYVQGWYAMHIMAEGIRHTLEEGNDLTGANIRESLETMGPIDTGGVIGDGEVEFDTESHRGSIASGIYTVEDGEITELEAGVQP